jgi:hypothetical protein
MMPMTNPDGAEFDIATDSFTSWRKNHQPTPSNPTIGTDPNHNRDTQWGCCGESSDSPPTDDYQEPQPFSTPKTAQIRDWATHQAIGDEQQITVHID